MAGCVPVCGLIDGITDFLVDHGRTGFIEKLGDASGFADAVEKLHLDRSGLSRMGRDVGIEARARYTDEVAADAYAALIREVMDAPAPPWSPRPWSAFKPDPNFPGYWRNRIPEGVRTVLRKFR